MKARNVYFEVQDIDEMKKWPLHVSGQFKQLSWLET